MAIMTADDVGLRMLAAHCQSWAGDLIPADQHSSGPSWQATSIVVAAIEASVDEQAEALADVMRSIATDLSIAADHYERCDESSMIRLEAAAMGL